MRVAERKMGEFCEGGCPFCLHFCPVISHSIRKPTALLAYSSCMRVYVYMHTLHAFMNEVHHHHHLITTSITNPSQLPVLSSGLCSSQLLVLAVTIKIGSLSNWVHLGALRWSDLYLVCCCCYCCWSWWRCCGYFCHSVLLYLRALVCGCWLWFLWSVWKSILSLLELLYIVASVLLWYCVQREAVLVLSGKLNEVILIKGILSTQRKSEWGDRESSGSL